MTPNRSIFSGSKANRWTVLAVAVLSFTAGSLITTRLAHIDEVRADSDHVYELRVYHTLPGKVPALETRFRDIASKLLAKHNLKVVGYWVPEGTPDWDNTFIYVVEHSSRLSAKENWDAMKADPGLQELIRSEQTNKVVEKIDGTYMRPTDFSPMK